MQAIPPSPADAPAVSVVLPVYRNETELRDVHAALTAEFHALELTYELVFVDDASPDGSAGILASLAAADELVVVVTNAENVGQHRAVLTGLRVARGEVVIVMDADGQDPPQAIPRLLKRLGRGVDAVFAGRRGAYESGGRLLTSRVFKWLLHRLAGVPRDAGMYVAMNRRMVDSLLALPEPPAFVVALVGLTGLPACSVPVTRKRRSSGRSAYTGRMRLRVALTTLADVWRWKRAHKAAAAPALAIGPAAPGVGGHLETHDAEQRRYYESTDHPNLHARESRYLRRHMEVALAAAEVQPHDAVLEVGCGMGRYTVLLADDLPDLHAADISPVLLDKVAEFDEGRHPGLRLHHADIAAPPREAYRAFDVVLGFFMLHHLHDLTASFRGIARMLKPGGRVVFVEPNPLNILYYIQMLISPGMSFSGDRGILKMRPAIIDRAMLDAGLAPGDFKRFGFFPPRIAETAWGARLERLLERFPLWYPLLPFHVFTATLPVDAPEPALDDDAPSSAAAPSSPPRPASRLLPWWSRLGTVAFVTGYLMSVFGGIYTADEAWFLYLLQRVTHNGETLYRDVWYNCFPLAVWVGATFTRLLGTEVLVLKAVSTLCFVATLLGCAAAARRLGASADHRALILAAMLGFAPPGVLGPGSLYTPMAFALLAATFATTLAWLDSAEGGEFERVDGLLLLAAALAGLAFSAKFDIGTYTLVALSIVVAAVERADLRRTAALIARSWAMFAAALGVTLLPVLFTGGLGAMWTDAVASKGTYLAHAGYAYFDGLAWLGAALFSPRSIWSIGDALKASLYLLPPVAIPLGAFAWARTRDSRFGAMIAFTLAALAGTWPRTDYVHLVGAVPFLFVALVAGWRELRPRLLRPVATVLSTVLVAIIVLRLVFAVAELPRRYADDPMVLSDLPHFANAPMRSSEASEAEASAEALRVEGTGRRVFVLSARAGFLYLASGLDDPTRFDYPVTTVISAEQQDEIVMRVRSGEIGAIWFDPLIHRLPGHTPLVIRDFMWTELHAWPQHPWGRLYTLDIPPQP